MISHNFETIPCCTHLIQNMNKCVQRHTSSNNNIAIWNLQQRQKQINKYNLLTWNYQTYSKLSRNIHSEAIVDRNLAWVRNSMQFLDLTDINQHFKGTLIFENSWKDQNIKIKCLFSEMDHLTTVWDIAISSAVMTPIKQQEGELNACIAPYRNKHMLKTIFF